MKTSEIFWRSFPGCGIDQFQCTGCGTHYVAKNATFEPEVWKEINAQSKANPSSVIFWDCDGISVIEIDNLYIVEDCEKCDDRLSRYEKFIWDNREGIRAYLEARSKQMVLEGKVEMQKNRTMGDSS